MPLVMLALAGFLSQAARADIAERQEITGIKPGVTNLLHLPQARGVAQPRGPKPFKLLPRPHASPPKIDGSGLRQPLRQGTASAYQEAATPAAAAATPAFSPQSGASFSPAAAATPPPSASFAALLDDNTTYNPDTAGAVGPNHVMSIAGSFIRVWSRTNQ